MSGDKGNFKTELPKEILDAALDAVKKRETGAEGVELEVEQPAEATPPPAETSDTSDTSDTSAKDKEIDELKIQLDVSMTKGRELMEKIKGEHEKMLRSAADLENYKKRSRKELEETQKFGNEKLLKDFLPVLDNIDRALEPTNSADVESLRKGVEMIRKLLEDTLGKHGVKPFTSKGKPFDPNVHEAMSQAETDDMPPNYVHTEILRGFTLNERLVRPGLVIVSKAKPKEAKEEPKPAEETPPPPAANGDGGSNG